MFRPQLWHKATLLLLAVCLFTSAASAGEFRASAALSTSVESLQPEGLVSWLAEALTAFWSKAGAGFDPFGLHATPPPPTDLEETTSYNPTPPQGDAGAEFDPFG